jgi:hypothetical protein
MSRVIYANTQSTADQESLRAEHKLRLVTEAEEGTGVDALPAGVYGFTYSPALPNAPLFAGRRFRSFETHKLASGEVRIVGFASPEAAAALSAQEEAEIQLQPEPEPGADVLVIVPYTRIRHHRQYAVRTDHGIALKIGPES